jgi:hypothetical protein
VLAIVQFDCAATPLLERLIGEGRLPALAQLRERGQWTVLDTPAMHFPAGTYHSLYSGHTLARHGQHYAFQWQPEHQRLEYRTAFDRPPTVWERADAAGLSTLVIDPYESQQPAVRNGTVLSGWQFENVISLERWSAPAAATGELTRLFGRAPLLQEVFGRPTARYLLGIRRRLLAGPPRIAAAATHLIARDQPDFAWITFLSAHLAGHMFWDTSEVAAGFDADTRRLLDTTLAEVYEACDAAIGRIVSALPDGSDLILMSPMGMDRETSRVDVLPAMLAAVLSGRPADPGAGGLLWRMRGAVPIRARAAVARAGGRRLTQQLTCRLSVLRTDWSQTRAFMLPSDHHGQIRLNVRGRDRDGIVDPADADALAAEIADGLMSFREPDGTRSIAEVWRTRDVMPPGAPALDALPDLVVRFARTPMPADGTSRSEQFGSVVRDGPGSGRSGGHNTDAWALLAPATAAVRDVDRPGVLDIPATVCSLLGLPTDDLDGDPLLERAQRPAPAPA